MSLLHSAPCSDRSKGNDGLLLCSGLSGGRATVRDVYHGGSMIRVINLIELLKQK